MKILMVKRALTLALILLHTYTHIKTYSKANKNFKKLTRNWKITKYKILLSAHNLAFA